MEEVSTDRIREMMMLAQAGEADEGASDWLAMACVPGARCSDERLSQLRRLNESATRNPRWKEWANRNRALIDLIDGVDPAVVSRRQELQPDDEFSAVILALAWLCSGEPARAVEALPAELPKVPEARGLARAVQCAQRLWAWLDGQMAEPPGSLRPLSDGLFNRVARSLVDELLGRRALRLGDVVTATDMLAEAWEGGRNHRSAYYYCLALLAGGRRDEVSRILDETPGAARYLPLLSLALETNPGAPVDELCEAVPVRRRRLAEMLLKARRLAAEGQTNAALTAAELPEAKDAELAFELTRICAKARRERGEKDDIAFLRSEACAHIPLFDRETEPRRSAEAEREQQIIAVAADGDLEEALALAVAWARSDESARALILAGRLLLAHALEYEADASALSSRSSYLTQARSVLGRVGDAPFASATQEAIARALVTLCYCAERPPDEREHAMKAVAGLGKPSPEEPAEVAYYRGLLMLRWGPGEERADHLQMVLGLAERAGVADEALAEGLRSACAGWTDGPRTDERLLNLAKSFQQERSQRARVIRDIVVRERLIGLASDLRAGIVVSPGSVGLDDDSALGPLLVACEALRSGEPAAAREALEAAGADAEITALGRALAAAAEGDLDGCLALPAENSLNEAAGCLARFLADGATADAWRLTSLAADGCATAMRLLSDPRLLSSVIAAPEEERRIDFPEVGGRALAELLNGGADAGAVARVAIALELREPALAALDRWSKQDETGEASRLFARYAAHLAYQEATASEACKHLEVANSLESHLPDRDAARIRDATAATEQEQFASALAGYLSDGISRKYRRGVEVCLPLALALRELRPELEAAVAAEDERRVREAVGGALQAEQSPDLWLALALAHRQWGLLWEKHEKNALSAAEHLVRGGRILRRLLCTTEFWRPRSTVTEAIPSDELEGLRRETVSALIEDHVRRARGWLGTPWIGLGRAHVRLLECLAGENAHSSETPLPDLSGDEALAEELEDAVIAAIDAWAQREVQATRSLLDGPRPEDVRYEAAIRRISGFLALLPENRAALLFAVRTCNDRALAQSRAEDATGVVESVDRAREWVGRLAPFATPGADGTSENLALSTAFTLQAAVTNDAPERERLLRSAVELDPGNSNARAMLDEIAAGGRE
ncbi:MAG: hypothetical protein ACQER1_11885 [Armatimonadota bacterium]